MNRGGSGCFILGARYESSHGLSKYSEGKRLQELLTRYAFCFQFFFSFKYLLLSLFALTDLSESDCDASSVEESVELLMSDADASDSDS